VIPYKSTSKEIRGLISVANKEHQTYTLKKSTCSCPPDVPPLHSRLHVKLTRIRHPIYVLEMRMHHPALPQISNACLGRPVMRPPNDCASTPVGISRMASFKIEGKGYRRLTSSVANYVRVANIALTSFGGGAIETLKSATILNNPIPSRAMHPPKDTPKSSFIDIFRHAD
jgi:hypothetical protein